MRTLNLLCVRCQSPFVRCPRGFNPLFSRTVQPLLLCVSEWPAQVHTGAQLHRHPAPPQPNPPNVLCVLCPFSLGPCSVGATVCVSRFQKKKKKKAFEILSTAHLP